MLRTMLVWNYACLRPDWFMTIHSILGVKVKFTVNRYLEPLWRACVHEQESNILFQSGSAWAMPQEESGKATHMECWLPATTQEADLPVCGWKHRLLLMLRLNSLRWAMPRRSWNHRSSCLPLDNSPSISLIKLAIVSERR